MDLRIEITSPDGSVQRLPVSGGATRVQAAAGQQYRLIDLDGAPVGIDATVRRVDDDLVVVGETVQLDLAIENFFTVCEGGQTGCQFSIAELGAPAGETITASSEPVGAVAQGGFLLWASPGLVATPIAQTDNGIGWRPIAGIGAGLLLIGATAGGGADTAVAADSTPPPAPTIEPILTSNSSLPLLTGTAEPGSTVRLTIDIGTTGQRVTYQTTAGSDGVWSVDTATAVPLSGAMPATGLPTDVASTVRIVAIDAGNNTSAVAVGSIQIDTEPPTRLARVDDVRSDAPAPVNAEGQPTSAPGLALGPGIVPDGGATNDPSPTINGSIDGPLDPGDQVIVYRNGSAVGVATVTGTDWTFTDIQVPEGRHVYTASVADRAGNRSPATAGITIEVDGTAPIAPTIDLVSNDDVITNADAQQPVVITGTGEAGTTIALSWGAVTRETTVAADGTWSITFDATTLPGNGVRPLTISSTDRFGNQTDGSARPVSITTGLPTAPVVDTDASSILGGPVAAINAVESANGVQITGTADAGATITLALTPLGGGTPIVSIVTADAGGRFVASFAPGSIAQGRYSVQAVAVDSAGNTVAGPALTVIVDTVAPTNTPVITSATGNEGNNALITSGGVINDASPTLAGTATGSADGDQVIVSRDGVVVGIATVSAGRWTFTDRAVADGQHRYTAVIADPAGNTGPVSGQVFVLGVDTIAPAAPSIDVVAGDDIVTAAEAGAGIVVSGSGEAGSTIRISWGGQAIDTQVGADGRWSVRYASPPADGRTQVTAIVTDTAGNESSAFRPVDVDTRAPAPPTIGAIAGDDRINAAEAAQSIMISGRAEPNTTINVTWGGLNASTRTSESGFWSVEFASPAAQGNSSITVTATDTGSNTSAVVTRPVFVDTIAPAQPQLDAVAGDNVITADEARDGIRISGRGEAGASIQVDWAGVARTTTVGADGVWSVSYASPPAQGATVVTVIATDGAGNSSAPASAGVTVSTIDVTPPPPPVINVIEGNDVVSVTEAADGVQIRGTAEAGTQVIVSWGGLSQNATTDANGAWSVTFATPPLTGDSSVRAVARDGAGNVSETSARTVTVETAPPPPPPPPPPPAPPAPVIGLVAGDDTVNADERSAGVTITGTAQANADIAVTWGGTTIITTATATGSWSARFQTNQVPVTTTPVSAVASDDGGDSPAGKPARDRRCPGTRTAHHRHDRR